MYNSLKKCWLVPAVIFLLCSCSGKVQLDNVDKSYTTDTITVSAKIPQLNGIKSSDLEEKINNEYMTICSRLLNEFSESAKKTKEESVFNIETTEHYSSGEFLSIVTQVDSSARKTRKNSFRLTKNIDLKNCIEVELSELFADDSYIDMLNSCLEKETSKEPEKYADLWERPKITDSQRFFINDKCLVVFYAPYELSYYERGFVEIPIELVEISGYLKPEYRKMFLK